MDDQPLERRKKLRLDDDDLQELIAERLDADPVFHLGRDRRVLVEVEVNDGKVILHGVVRTALVRRKADILARALGATTVDNRLRVDPEEPFGTSHANIRISPA